MPSAAPESFEQLKLLVSDPIQHDYEVIRPVVLFAQSISTRSTETGLDRSTVGEKARRFVQQGMLGLVDQRTTKAGRKSHVFPKPVAAYLLYLKHLYPPLHYRELVRIIARKYGYKTNHHTVKHFLNRYDLPVQLPLPLTHFHDVDDAYRARWTVVRMYYEGWHQQSIAGCLQLSRQHVGNIIAAFERDGFAGLEDQRTRPADHPHNQLTLPLLQEVLDVQQTYPRIGRFRVRGELEARRGDQGSPVPSEATVGRAMALNRQFHGAPGPWPPKDTVPQRDGPPKPLPYTPTYAHEYWFLDVRYLVRLDGKWVYSICILEGYSRKIVAGMASPYQDLVAVLQLLCAALTEYGCPGGVVSDNGGVFQAQDYASVLAALDIDACFIEKGKPWQNLIETQFKVQARLGDAAFEQAHTLDEVQVLHAAFVDTFNTTTHWAHRRRAVGEHTPANVLGVAQGRPLNPAQLRHLLRDRQFLRTVNRHGFVSVQRFSIYAERGLAKRRVAVWIYEGDLRIEYQQTLLARYQCSYHRRRKRLTNVRKPVMYHTPFASPQLEFWELDDDQWLKVVHHPARRRWKRSAPPRAIQLPLFGLVVLFVTQQLATGLSTNVIRHSG